ncbi:GILT-like protein F37H8.5 [Drosophila montana]|uniref:GILT-like protein F37H8.5 n=1 Tax=Drosophila montana TaxID=40370 RepID=UPI00313E3714
MCQFLAAVRPANMKGLYIILCLLPSLECGTSRCRRSIKPLGMTVLYESLCPDSQEFLTRFWPVFRDYHNCINLTLVPYGKARPAGRGHACQHGRPECWGNRMQDCALHSNLNQLKQMQFITCQMQDLQLVRRRNFKCAKSLNIVKSVRQCMKPNGQGNDLQAEASRITSQYAFNEIPAIIYNGVLDDDLQAASNNNLRQTLCEIMVKTKHLLPHDC